MNAHWTRRHWILTGIALGCGAVNFGVALVKLREKQLRREEEELLAKNAPQALGVVGGAEGAAILRQPEKVQAWRIKHKAPEPWNTPEKLDDVERTSPLVEVPLPVAEQIAQTLLSPLTYEFELEAACHPSYGVQLRFEREDRRLDLWLCFQCANLRVFVDGAACGECGGYFPYGAPALAAQMKILFPEDAEIQGLSEAPPKRRLRRQASER